jgi:hypothetical protein
MLSLSCIEIAAATYATPPSPCIIQILHPLVPASKHRLQIKLGANKRFLVVMTCHKVYGSAV